MGETCPKCKHDNPPDTLFCGRCATRLDGSGQRPSFTRTLETPTAGEFARGSILAGRFEVIEELGAGGMGRVLRAFDKEVGEEVAVKLLHPEIALDPRTIERFRNEIKLARKIAHRNVCRMHDLHQDGRTLYITMEYVSGQDLKGLIRQTGALATGTTLAIARQVAEGLAEAHRLGVVHRDLKPQNIMVDKDGTAKIMDFGIARSIYGAGVTSAGTLIGTPDYMSPEQVEGKEADRRSDIYSLGVILFEMVTGRVPFEGDTPLSVAYKHKNELPIPPRKLNSQVPEPFNKVILRCLEKERADRYQTADELLADLALVEEGLPITERVAAKTRMTSQRSALKSTGLRRLLVPALAGLGIIIIALVFWRVLPRGKAAVPDSGKPSLAVLYFDNSSGDPALDPWKTQLSSLLIISLSQTRAMTVLDDTRTYGVLKKLKLDQAGKYGPDDLVKVASEGKVNHTASGRIMKAGTNIIISLTLQDLHAGEPVSSRRVECRDEADILAKVDELAAGIRSDLRLTPAQIAADAPKPIAEITTKSPEALKYYLESLDAFQMMDYTKSTGLLEKAVELDPDFALAYTNLALMYEIGGETQSKVAATRKKAYDLRSRLPEKERLYVEANESLSGGEKTAVKTIEIYRQYFEYAPNDALEMQSLALTYWSLGQYDKGLEISKRAYQLDQSPQIMLTITQNYEFFGEYEKADQIYRDYLKDGKDDFSVHWLMFWLQILRKRYDLAFEEIEKGFLLNPKIFDFELFKGHTHLFSGNASEAEKIYRQIIKSEDKAERRAGINFLIQLHLLKGKFSLVSEELGRALAPGQDFAGAEEYWMAYVFLRAKQHGKALEIIEKRIGRDKANLLFQRRGLWLKGLINIQNKSWREAESAAAELKKLIDAWPNKKYMRFFDHLVGSIEIEKGNMGKAVEILQRACALLDYEDHWLGSRNGFPENALLIDSLASAYYKSGDINRALLEYQRLSSLTVGRWKTNDLYAKSFYWLGKIAEAQKDKKRAVDNYGKFLNLWKDADPGQPELDDARVRLAALK